MLIRENINRTSRLLSTALLCLLVFFSIQSFAQYELSFAENYHQIKSVDQGSSGLDLDNPNEASLQVDTSFKFALSPNQRIYSFYAYPLRKNRQYIHVHGPPLN